MIFYSPSTRGFYDDTIHAKLPTDAVAISEEDRTELLAGEAQGLQISVDATGWPVLMKPMPQTAEQEAAVERNWRDSALLLPCAMRDRHRDETELGLDTTLSAQAYAELLGYIQQLRAWPQSDLFPDVDQRPTAPLWIAEQHL